MFWMAITPVVILLDPVVPNSVPTLDNLVSGLSKRMDFVNTKLKQYTETKAKREKVMEFLRELREKNHKMRRTLMKNCRRLLCSQKNREIEKQNQQKASHDRKEAATDMMEEMDNERSSPFAQARAAGPHHHHIGQSLYSRLPDPVGDFMGEEPQTRHITNSTFNVITEKKRLGKAAKKSIREQSSNSNSDSSDLPEDYWLSREQRQTKKVGFANF